MTKTAMKSRGGRPPAINITPEDAKIVREAVKLAARYYGTRLQDLGKGGSWITSAMRTKAPMPVETAEELLKVIAHPRPGLVGKRRPQGTSGRAIMERFVALRRQLGENPPVESFADVKDDVGARFIGFGNMAALILQKYLLPYPGTAVFVMPGTSRLVVQKLIEAFPIGSIKKQRAKDIEDALVPYFELGEKPLEADHGKELIPRLTILSLIENFRDVVANRKAEGWSEEALRDLETWAKDVIGSERRRGRAQRRGSSK